MFADPRDGSLYRIPLGLLYAKGHSAAQVCAMTKSLMVSFGFSSKDLFHSVNDNTNSAVLAGKYILEHRGEGKCDMHKTDLVLKHATGLVVRTRNKQTIDSNPSFTSLYRTIREFVSWLMNKVARSRYNNLKQHCATKNRRVIEIPLPNKTRVAGVAIMYKALIRNKWEMDAYAALPHGGDSAFTKKYPTMEQWQQLSEFEAVLDPLQRCSISLQTDDPAINSASMLEIYLCRRHIERMRNGCLHVLSMDASTYSKGDLWDASSQMEDSNKKRRKVQFPHLLGPTRHLIHRLVKEFQSYVITENDTKAELTICANPLLVITAPRAFKYMGYFDDKDIEAMHHRFISDMVNKFAGKPHELGAAFARQAELANTDLNENDNNAGDNNKEDQEEYGDDIFRAMAIQEAKKQQQLGNITGEFNTAGQDSAARKELRKKCKDTFDDYVWHCENIVDIDWASTIQQFPSELFVKESSSWKHSEVENFRKICTERNYIAVGKYFDVMGWWQAFADKYIYVYPSALTWLSRPATNAFQERVFSLGSWFDSNQLMRCQGAKTFEMRTLECITRDLRCQITTSEKKILNQQREDRKKKPKDIFSIIQKIRQEDAVGSISPRLTNPAFSDKDDESVVEVVLSGKAKLKQKQEKLVSMMNAMQSFIENEDSQDEDPHYQFVQDGVDEELDKQTGVSIVKNDGKPAAQVILDADGLGLPNELDEDFGFGELVEEDDGENDEDIDDDQSMIRALMKEIADIESGHGEEVSDADKNAASKVRAKKKLEISQKDSHGGSVSHVNWEENEEEDEIIDVEESLSEEEKERDNENENTSRKEEDSEISDGKQVHSEKGNSPTTRSMSSSQGKKKRFLLDWKSGSATKKTKKRSNEY